MALGLCGPTSGEVYGFISDGWTTYQHLANQQYQGMESQINELNAFIEDVPLSAINTEIGSLIDASDFGAGFFAPIAPDPEDITFERPQGVMSIASEPVAGPVLSAKPVFSGVKPTLDLSGQPATFSEVAPTATLTISDAAIPDAPAIAETLPDVADLLANLREIDLPTRQSLAIPNWAGVKPEDDTFVPRGSFDWQEDAYTSANQDAVVAEVARRFNGGSGLPADFWNALVERDKLQQEEAALRAEEEVTDIWGRNGWDAPTWAEVHALQRVRHEVFRQESGRVREVWLEQTRMEEDSLRFAVVQGIAAEQLLTGFHSDQAARGLQAAQFAQDVSIRLAGLHIERLNARYGAYATDAQVYKTRIEAEVSKLEQQRFDLDAARLKGELNDQDIRVFLAQYEAADKLIQLFLGEIEGVKARNEVDKTRAQVFGEQVRAYAEKIRANGLAWDGWSKKVDGQLGVGQLYKTEAQAFGELMRGYGIEADAENKRVDSEVRMRTLDLSRIEADTRRFEAESRSESERVSSLARKFEALVRRYESSGRIEESRVRSEDNRVQILLEEMRAKENLRLRKSEVDINQILRLLDIEKTGIESILNVRAQLVASLYSAFNLNAGLSGDFENQSICQTTYTG